MVTEVDIYRWLLEAVKIRSRVPSGDTIHVSEVVGCLRRAYYLRTRAFQLSPANALKLLGDGIHTAFQEVLRREGFETEFKVGIDLKDFRLVGHVDAYHPERAEVLELKTVNQIPERPYDTHLKQAQIYRALASVKHAYIIYISRADGKVRVFKVDGDRGVLGWAVGRAKALKEALTRGEPPKPEETRLCNHCEFTLVCSRR